jgi:MFS family permease
MRIKFGGLWQHPDFVRLWTGQTVSVFGSLTTRLALPFTAVIFLDAPGWQVALLASSDVIAGIAVGLFAGVWADRLRRRPIMIAADLARAVTIASVPLAALFSVLHMPQLYVVAFASGVLTTFFDVAYQSYLPTLVTEEELLEGNSKLTGSASVAEAGAFGAAGWLAQLLTAPGAMAIDAVTFLVSAASLARIKTPEPPPAPPHEREPVLAEIAEGLRTIRHDTRQLVMAGTWMCMSLSTGMIGAVIILFVTRDLGFSPGAQGLIYAVGGVTSLGGAIAAGWCRARLGAGGTMALGLVLGGAGVLAMTGAPASMLWLAALMLIAQQIISDPGWTIYDINLVSLRQAITPDRLLGRVNSAFRFAGLSAALTGSLTTVAIVGPLGPRWVLIIGSLVSFAGAALVLLSPVRREDAELVADPIGVLTHAHIAEVTDEV